MSVSLGRMLGRVARRAVDEVDVVTQTLRDFITPAPAPSRRLQQRSKRQPVRELLQRLGEVVTAHSAPGYETLQSNQAFWRLVEELHARRPQNQPKGRPGKPHRTVPAGQVQARQTKPETVEKKPGVTEVQQGPPVETKAAAETPKERPQPQAAEKESIAGAGEAQLYESGGVGGEPELYESVGVGGEPESAGAGGEAEYESIGIGGEPESDE
jgi:hypothetical protein